MNMVSAPSQNGRSAELNIGGDLSLAFINTSFLEGGVEVDLFQSDVDVLCWLGRVGLPAAGMKSQASGSLLCVARRLRETVRDNVLRKKASRPLDLSVLNEFLGRTCSHLEIVDDEKKQYCLLRAWPSGKVEQIVARIAEAAVQLLVEEDFDLVKQCESSECVLWFLDTSKAHKRRWCSMATCGNRAKSSSFRVRSEHRKQSTQRAST